ncbi:MAG: sulfatase [Lentisphaeraceae bacterium]|nr:sulfatase [Lentisphaeraceae bacterium]
MILKWLLLLFFITASNASEKPNILFCITDDQSWIHTSFAGDPVVKTPGFDRVAKAGIYFENSFTNCPSCAPSRASVLTGQKFWRLEEGGVLFGRLKKKFPIISNLLANAGYEVAATGKGYQPSMQIFENTWNNIFYKNVAVRKKVHESVTPIDYTASFQKFLDTKSTDKPFFFWYGAREPHRPYKYGIGKENGVDPSKVIVPPFLPDSEEVRNDIADYLFEIQWQDAHLERMLNILEKRGELSNTLVVVTSDNGMPFPRAKATAYNYGVHMPLAIMYGDKIKGNRRVTDFVNHEDFAPTFLELAGLKVPNDMTGKSLVNILKSDKSGRIEPERNYTVSGLERHTWCRPGGATYPRRVIHTDEFVYIRNYNPERFPNGNPDFESSHFGGYGEYGTGATKEYMLKHKDSPQVKEAFMLSFEKLPAEELYRIKQDPNQLHNLAGNSEYKVVMDELRVKLHKEMKDTGDPRANGESPWDDYPFYRADYVKGKYLEEYQEALKKNPKRKKLK